MSAYRETKLHGTHGFPYIVYLGIIPEYTGGVALHWHEEMEIIYVTEGTVQVSVRQSDHVLSNGDIVLVHPQTIHAIRQYGESSARYYNILFRFSLLENGAEDTCRKKYLAEKHKQELIRIKSKRKFVTIQNNKKLYTCTKEILKYRIAGMQMKEIQIGHTLCSPETLKTPLKNLVRQNAQSSVGRGIAKFR